MPFLLSSHAGRTSVVVSGVDGRASSPVNIVPPAPSTGVAGSSSPAPGPRRGAAAGVRGRSSPAAGDSQRRGLVCRGVSVERSALKRIVDCKLTEKQIFQPVGRSGRPAQRAKSFESGRMPIVGGKSVESGRMPIVDGGKNVEPPTGPKTSSRVGPGRGAKVVLSPASAAPAQKHQHQSGGPNTVGGVGTVCAAAGGGAGRSSMGPTKRMVVPAAQPGESSGEHQRTNADSTAVPSSSQRGHPDSTARTASERQQPSLSQMGQGRLLSFTSPPLLSPKIPSLSLR